VTAERTDDRGLATRIRERSVIHAYKLATWTLGRVPQRASWEVSSLLAEGAYLSWPARRRATRASLAHVLGTTPDDRRVDRLARRMYRNYGEYVVELMRLPTMPPGALVREVDLSAADEIEEARGLDRGVIMVGAHLGHNEAGAASVADRGWHVSVLGDDTEYRELFDHLSRQRAAWGIHLLPWRNLRGMYTALRRHELVGMLVDWGYRPDGVPVRLFGEWTTLPPGPATLAARTGAVIMPIAIPLLQSGTMRYRGETSPLIEVASAEPAEIARATQAIAAAMERAIRRYPDQWWVFKAMWPETAQQKERLLARLAGYGLSPESPAAER